jgi:hypothetical protein
MASEEENDLYYYDDFEDDEYDEYDEDDEEVNDAD